MNTAKISIDEEMGIAFADEGAWRAYHTVTSGNTLLECIEEATIIEIDQDGGEIDCYDLASAHDTVYDVAERIIAQEFVRQTDKKKKAA